MNNLTHLDWIEELGEYEVVVSMFKDREELKKIESQEYEAFNFQRFRKREYNQEINLAMEQKDIPLAQALYRERYGYEKGDMTKKEVRAEHKMLQKFVSLGFMMEDDDDSEEDEGVEE